MNNADLTVALVVGISLSIVFADTLGIIPGGIIVPSFVALAFRHPVTLVGILLVAVLAYFVVNFLGRFVILYGRRKFGAMILAALFIRMGLAFLFKYFVFDYLDFHGVGMIVPGLVANCFDRQGVVPTLAGLLFLGGLTYAGVLLYGLF